MRRSGAPIEAKHIGTAGKPTPLEQNLAADGAVLIADPLRSTSLGFMVAMESDGWAVEFTRYNIGEPSDMRPMGVLRLSRTKNLH